MKIVCFKTGDSSIFNVFLMFFISSAPLIQAFKFSVCHKKVPNRILYFIFGDKILGQSGPKRPKKAQTVQENQGGQKWSKTIVSQHRPQNSVSNCFRDTFGTPIYI